MTDAAGGSVPAAVLAYRGGRLRPHDDQLAQEVPVALVFNGISHAVMMATPLGLEDFALGFAITEGLLERRSELYGVEVVPDVQGVRVEMSVSSASFVRLKERRRSMAGRTGCGLCGAENLEQVRLPLRSVVADVRVAPAAIARALRELQAAQQLQQVTGAVHAAAWCGLEGDLRIAREDVGRHNALDKTIGAMLRQDTDPTQGFLVVTSRASFEMVQKAVMARAALLVAVSAPTSLALESAHSAGLTLVGFARGSDFVVYAHSQRLFPQPNPLLAPEHETASTAATPPWISTT